MATIKGDRYRENLRKTVFHFVRSVDAHVQGVATDSATQTKVLGDFKNTCVAHSDDIIDNAFTETVRYLNYYSVIPTDSVDEFKLIYFLGRAISSVMDKQSLPEARKLTDIVTISLLDRRLEYKGGKSRPMMTRALNRIATHDDFDEKLGVHGMYLMYKCVDNTARGN